MINKENEQNEMMFKKKQRKIFIFKIEGEYDISKIFDPVKGSPNIFLNNLQNRMRQYYNVLSKKYK